MTDPRPRLDLAAIRARLDAARGPQYWRCLEELAQEGGFEELLQREFPRQAAEWTDPVSRRRFLQLMGASLALAGLSGCAAAPPEKIMPYVRQPEELVPGKPLFFATAMPLAGYASGLLVESHMGRPTKVEGNPNHPASPPPTGHDPASPHTWGPTDVFSQASVLTLYDPDRSQSVRHLGDISNWQLFVADLRRELGIEGKEAKRPNVRLRILTEAVSSPILAHQINVVLGRFPKARWHHYEPAGRDNVRAGGHLAFGKYVETRYNFDQAEVILSLDADFLTCGPGHLKYVHDFSNRRRVGKDPGTKKDRTAMSRLYAVESTATTTGAKADQRWPLKAGEVVNFARAVAARLGIELDGPANHPVKWIDSLVADLQKAGNRGKSLVIAGDQQPPFVHALAHALNDKLGNVNHTVVYTGLVEALPSEELAGHHESLGALVKDMKAGQVDVLLIVGGNPVYMAPADVDFAAALDKVPLRAHLSLYDDETSALCQWHLPEAHFLETWGDARAFDGTVTILQPLIAPLYGGHSAQELLALLTGQAERTSHDVVRSYWKNVTFREQPLDRGYDKTRAYWDRQRASRGRVNTPGLPRLAAGEFERWWRRALHDGLVEGSDLAPEDVVLGDDWKKAADKTSGGRPLEIVFRPDPTIFDGRFANNAWLQELPKPITQLTWDNAALISPRTAEANGLSNNDRIELRYGGRSVKAPVWVLPGHPDDSVTVHLGYGRTRAGKVGTGAGFNAYALRTARAPDFDTGLEIHPTGETYALASTQGSHLMEGRNHLRSGTLAEYQRDPRFAQKIEPSPRYSLTLYTRFKYEGYKWGMAIDLNACTGCNACVVACQAENNVPVVGKDQVLRGRHMHWLRVDSYYKGGLDNPETYFQPVPCMHCENAPCEQVCPVEATVHSSEGLNEMVYNRCVGTRYCSNNCPYKVRRFNFLAFTDYAESGLNLLHNPEVTVRSRGVMEKCTYCVQRISRARIEAEKEERFIRDGEVQTACQAACPAGAIVFGDLNDRGNPGTAARDIRGSEARSRVAQLQEEPRNYAMLAELNTRPRTTYLAALRNPHTPAPDGKAP